MANLLPQNLKKESRREYILRVVFVGLCTSAAVLCVGVAALVPTYVLLDAKLSAIDQPQKPQDSKKEDTVSADAVQTVRSYVELLKQDTSSEEIPYGIFAKLFEVKGGGSAITFSRISFSRLSQTLHVSGKAAVPKDLVDFMNRIGEEKAFVPIPKEQFPYADLTGSKDVPFSFDIKMNQAQP